MSVWVRLESMVGEGVFVFSVGEVEAGRNMLWPCFLELRKLIFRCNFIIVLACSWLVCSSLAFSSSN